MYNCKQFFSKLLFHDDCVIVSQIRVQLFLELAVQLWYKYVCVCVCVCVSIIYFFSQGPTIYKLLIFCHFLLSFFSLDRLYTINKILNINLFLITSDCNLINVCSVCVSFIREGGESHPPPLKQWAIFDTTENKMKQ